MHKILAEDYWKKKKSFPLTTYFWHFSYHFLGEPHFYFKSLISLSSLIITFFSLFLCVIWQREWQTFVFADLELVGRGTTLESSWVFFFMCQTVSCCHLPKLSSWKVQSWGFVQSLFGGSKYEPQSVISSFPYFLLYSVTGIGILDPPTHLGSKWGSV